MRIELYSSGNRIISPENQNFYNVSITLHGLLMIFFLVMPGCLEDLEIILHLSFKGLQKWYILKSIIFLSYFFFFHFQLPFLLCGFLLLHLFYLHFLSSSNPLRNSTNNKIPFFPFIFYKDFFGFILVLCLYF